MAGQTFTLQNTNTGADTGVTAFRVYVPWARGEITSINTLRLNYKVQINGLNYDTYWETFGVNHWDDSLHHTYAVFRYDLAAGAASPTAPAVTGTIVQVSNAVTPASFPTWSSTLDIRLQYTDDNPGYVGSLYDLQLGDVARDTSSHATTGASYSLTDDHGTRRVFYSGWTGDGSHRSPAARRTSSDPAHSTYVGNLHVYGFLEVRTGDTHGLLELFFANDAAYPAGTRSDASAVSAPDGVAYPLSPGTATCAATSNQDFRRWIDAALLTLSSPSATLYSAPIGVSNYTTGAGPIGTIAPSGADWTIPIQGLGWGGGWARAWIISTVNAADAETKATHFGTLYGYPAAVTAQAHRRQRNLQGHSMRMTGYRRPVNANLTAASCNTAFATGPAYKTALYASTDANPWSFPPGWGFNNPTGPSWQLGECREPFSHFVYAGSPWHLHVAYLRGMQDAGSRPYHKEIEALQSMSTLWDSTAATTLGYTAHWDGETHFWTSEVQFGLRTAPGVNQLCTWNGITAQTANPDPNFGSVIEGNNAEHYGTSPLFWIALITGSQMFRFFLREKAWIAARQLNAQHYATHNGYIRAWARLAESVLDGREIAEPTESYRDELLLIVQRHGSTLANATGVGRWFAGQLGRGNDTKDSIFTRFGLSAGPTEDYASRQWLAWQAPMLIFALMRAAFARPEGSGTDYAEECADVAEHLARIVLDHLVCIDPRLLTAEARRPIDGWYDARAAELAGTSNQPRNRIMAPKSRGVDVARSSGSDIVFTDYVRELEPRAGGQTKQQIAAFVAALSFRGLLERSGATERANRAITQFAAEYPEWLDGTDYFRSGFGDPVGYIIGATGTEIPSSDGILLIPALPIEGEDPPPGGDFGGQPPTPTQYQENAGMFAFMESPNQMPQPGPQYGFGGFASLVSGGTGGGGGSGPGTIREEIAFPFDEPEDVRCVILAVNGEVGEAVLTGPGLVPVYHGMRRSMEPVSMETSERKLYVANGQVRPVEYGPHGAAYAGVTPPAGEIDIEVEREAVGFREQGAILFTGDIAGSAITNITGYRFSSDDIGKLLYTGTRKDYLGCVSAVTAFDSITVSPGTLVAATGASVWLFPAKTTDGTVDSDSWENALELLPESTPYSSKRPKCDGTPAAGDSNPLCLQFRGLQAVIVEGVDTQLSQDSVIDFKCYLRAEKLDTQGGGRIVLWSRYSRDMKASFELSVIENGKLEFRFWDVNLKDWRSIQTVGQVLTIDEWYYVRLRYKLKNAGGWEPDDRNILRSTTSFGQSRYHRDGLWVWSMEGHRPADRFLVCPGARASFNRGTPAAYNTSREIGNVGYLQSDPWIGPRQGDQGFDDTITIASKKPVMMRANRSGAFVLTLHTNTDFFPARWMSTNRDEPYDLTNDGASQLNDVQANYYTGSTTPVTPGSAVTTNYGRALLCYVYGPRSGTAFTTPRILAVLSVGSTDLDTNTANSSDTSTIKLSSSVALGGDGLAENDAAGDLTTGDLIIAFAFPNGSNHAAAATGNTTPMPTLLVQGTNPVGTNDAPMNNAGPIYIGGIDRNQSITTSEGRASTRDAARINFVGRMDDVGFKLATLVQTQDEYTSDCMPPDHQFNGPADTRLMCLPPLDFTGATGNYDIGSSQTTGSATWASRMDSLRGNRLTSTTGSAPQAQARVAGFTSSTGGQPVRQHGKHRVAVTFYDPKRDHESPPSEIGEVTLQSQPDEFEPDAERAILLSRLPVSAEVGRPIWRRIYLTMPDGATFFRALEIRDNTTSQARISVDLVTLPQQERIDFGYQVPPVSRFLASSESRMFYGGILDAAAAVYWSDEFAPWRVPGRAEVLEASDGGYVTGLKVLNGTPYAFSRAGIFAGQEVGDGLIRWSRIQANTGAVSHTGIVEKEDALMLPDAKGVFAFDGTGRVAYLSKTVSGSYQALDPIALTRSFGAYSRRRDAYVLTGSEGRYPYQTVLLTLGSVWSREVHSEGLSSLLGGSDPRTDERQVFAGTPSGFVTQLDAGDRARGQYVGDHDLYGPLTATVLGGGGSYFVTLDVPDFDDALDGVSGVPYVITRVTEGHESLIDRGFIFRFDGVRAHTIQKVAADVQYGDRFYLGGWAMQWWSKQYDFRAHTMRKNLQTADLVFDQREGESIELTTHTDFGTEPAALKSCPMDRGFDTPHVTTRGAYVQVRLLKVCQRPTKIHNLALRVAVETQRGGGDGAAT